MPDFLFFFVLRACIWIVILPNYLRITLRHFLRRHTTPQEVKNTHREAKTHILILLPSLDKGGVEQVIIDMVTHIDKTNFQVYILCTQRLGNAAQVCSELGIHVECIVEPTEQELEAYILRHKIALVQLHSVYFPSDGPYLLGIPRMKKYGVRVVFYLHNTFVWFTEYHKRFVQYLDPYIDAYIAVSTTVKEYVSSNIGVNPEKICVIENGIDRTIMKRENISIGVTRETLGLEKDDYVFLNVASYTIMKGQNALISATKELKETFPNFKVLCFGYNTDPAYLELFKKRVRKYRLEDTILFLGYKDDIRKYYETADAFVLPSYFEGWSIAVLEALSFGLPLILTDSGGAREVIQNQDVGIMIPNIRANVADICLENILYDSVQSTPLLTQDLYRAMRTFIEEKAVWKEKGASGVKKLEYYDIQDVVRKYEKIFSELILISKP